MKKYKKFIFLFIFSILYANELVVTPKIIDLANGEERYDIKLYNKLSNIKNKFTLLLSNRYIDFQLQTHKINTDDYFLLRIYHLNNEKYPTSHIAFNYNNFYVNSIHFNKYDTPNLTLGFITKTFYKQETFFNADIGYFRENYSYYTFNIGSGIFYNVLKYNHKIAININGFLDKKRRKNIFMNTSYTIKDKNFNFTFSYTHLLKEDEESPLQYVAIQNNNYIIPYDLKNKNSKNIYGYKLEYKIFTYKQSDMFISGSYIRNKSTGNLYSLGIKFIF